MKKRTITMLLALVLTVGLLSGCMYNVGDVYIREDGSGYIETTMGYTMDLLQTFYKKTPEEYFAGKDFYTVNKNGQTFYVCDERFEFDDVTQLDWGSFYPPHPYLGTYSVSVEEYNGGYLVRFNKGIASKYYSIRDEEEYNGAYVSMTFHMPYPVQQVAGISKYVNVSGNTFTVNLHDMHYYDGYAWVFLSAPNPAPSAFNDVEQNKWYYKYIQEAFYAGYVNGYGNGNFGPNNTMTRAEFFTVMAKLCDPWGLKSDQDQADLNHISYWAWSALMTANQNSWTIVFPKGQSVFDRSQGQAVNFEEIGSAPMSRQEVAYALYNYYNFKYFEHFGHVNTIRPGAVPKDINDADPEYREAMTYCYQYGIFNGYSDGTVNPKGTLTRAELCTLITNLRWVYSG